MPAIRPMWLDDEPEIKRWLHLALDRLSAKKRTKPLLFSAEDVLFPGRVHHGDEASHRWNMIVKLCDLLPLKIKRAGGKRQGEFDHPYEGQRLHLDLSCEEILREWLDRPRITSYEAAWQTAVVAAKAPWSDAARAQLLNTPLRTEGRSAEEMVNAMVALGSQKDELSWRELSARVFFGDSKFVDKRVALVQTLYPQRLPRTRPLLFNASLPSIICGVLFIENHDTYLRAVEQQGGALRDVALIFAAGFKGSAARVRRRDGAVIHYCNENGARDGFESWWFEEEKNAWPVWFFGDLDFAGMRILAGLHLTFGAIAWQPGFAALLEQLHAGGGHRPDAADKEKQRSVESTGCPYADEVLLPAIRERGAFVDQEAWTPDR